MVQSDNNSSGAAQKKSVVNEMLILKIRCRITFLAESTQT